MRILVVDDQALNRSMLRFMLEHDGYEVLEAEDGQIALDNFEEYSPDLVLLDVIMPNLDGYKTAPLLKQKAGGLHLPIIFITALDSQDSLLKCLEVGGDDFLGKPFDKVVLSAKIKSHLRARELSTKVHLQNEELQFHANSVQREHEIVEHIFKNALRSSYMDHPSVNAYLSPASMFNGDLFLVARGPADNLYFFMGDFTGHGLASATGALPVSRTFFSMAQKGFTVSDIAYEVNSVLLGILPDHMFCAACVIELAGNGRNVSIWGGGLPEVIITDAKGKIKHKVHSAHMALGIIEEHEFERDSFNAEVANGDKIYVYTDGIIESVNTAGEMLGEEEFEHYIADNASLTIGRLVEWLNNFRDGAEQMDDISIAQICCQELFSEDEHEASKEISMVPWHFQLEMDPERLKRFDPAAQIVDMISAIQGFSEHRTSLFVLLSELYNNALDHGVLKLKSTIKDGEEGFFQYYEERMEKLSSLAEGYVKLTASFDGENPVVRIVIEDSGDGFDMSSNDITANESTHGRGISLISELAEEVNYSNNGSTVEVVYALN